MSAICKPSRARDSNRGGCGGGYERTSPTYDRDRLLRLRRDYWGLEPRWRPAMLAGLSRFERRFVADRAAEAPDH